MRLCIQRLIFSLAAVAAPLGCGGQDTAASGAKADAVVDVDASNLNGNDAAASLPSVVPVAPGTGDGSFVVEGQWLPGSAQIEVLVSIAGFSNVYGVAGRLRYDPTLLALDSMTPAGVPTGTGKDASQFKARTVAKESPVGRILLGGARIPNTINMAYQAAGTAVDKELWLTARFHLLQTGHSVIGFDPGTAIARGPDGTDQKVAPGSLNIDAASLPAAVTP